MYTKVKKYLKIKKIYKIYLTKLKKFEIGIDILAKLAYYCASEVYLNYMGLDYDSKIAYFKNIISKKESVILKKQKEEEAKFIQSKNELYNSLMEVKQKEKKYYKRTIRFSISFLFAFASVLLALSGTLLGNIPLLVATIITACGSCYSLGSSKFSSFKNYGEYKKKSKILDISYNTYNYIKSKELVNLEEKLNGYKQTLNMLENKIQAKKNAYTKEINICLEDAKAK